MDINKWEFAESLGDRKTNLLNPPNFETIIVSIQNEMKILCCHDQECRDDNRFSRAIYCLKISEPLFDLFFNSKHGYRAWYYCSPHFGLKINERLITTLLPFLLASDQTKEAEKNGFSKAKASESLKSFSAKAWLTEIGKEIDNNCAGCTGEWGYPQDDNAEIFNDRWDKTNAQKAKCGRKAPYLTKIRIFGAFLNSKHDEFIPADKRYRAKEIHEFGWS
jgi:hypothetical protein